MTNSGLAKGKDQRHETKTSPAFTIVLLPVLLMSNFHQALGHGNNLSSLQTSGVKIFVHIYSKQDFMMGRFRWKIFIGGSFSLLTQTSTFLLQLAYQSILPNTLYNFLWKFSNKFNSSILLI